MTGLRVVLRPGLRQVLMLGLLTVTAALGMALANPPASHRQRGAAIEALIQAGGEESLTRFAETQLDPAYRASFAPGRLDELLREIRRACAGFGGVLAGPADRGGTRLTFLEGAREAAVVFRTQEGEPHLIDFLALEASPPMDGSRPPATPATTVEPIAWENLEERLAEEAAAGFAGTVLVVRDDRIVLHEGYGLANREAGIPNGTGTIFAIGSVPIDFTKAAILKLEEMGRLKTSDPVSRFVGPVPADKANLSLDHLMTGASGLPDFHHEAGVDADRDLTWIDRDTAVRRILSQPLLFPPGDGEAHSHSAWVLLAAVVEIASKKSYEAFLKEQFFGPAGMIRTGNHESAAAWPDETFAVGYEGQPVGTLNIPKNWGRTSWLVMGSGGMQSTPIDLYRWLEAIRTHKTLGEAAGRRYLQPGVFAGGDDRGFYCLYNQGVGDRMILCSNAHSGRGDAATSVGRRLVELVMPRMERRPDGKQ